VKYSIQVDSREATKQPKIVERLERRNFNVEVQKLDVGDYLLFGERPILIERKSISNLVADVRSGHLWEQLKDLSQETEPCLRKAVLLEGSPAIVTKKNRWQPRAVTAILNSIVFGWKVPYLFAPSKFWTVETLVGLQSQIGKPEGDNKLRVKKRIRGLAERAQFVLEGLPGIGPSRAKSLLKRFGSLKGVLNATPQELREVLSEADVANLYVLLHAEVGDKC